jgi:hypothetical protein
MGTGTNAIALLSLLCCTSAQAVELGRLFSTAEERRQLDRPAGTVNAPLHRAIPMQGLTVRRGGEPTAWVDGRPLRRGDRGEGFVLLDAGQEGALILRDGAAPDSAAGDATGATP